MLIVYIFAIFEHGFFHRWILFLILIYFLIRICWIRVKRAAYRKLYPSKGKAGVL